MARIVHTRGIVIRRMNYGESSLILDIFTESHGLSGFIVSGVRKSRPAISPVVFTPGYELNLVFYEQDIHRLWRIKEASIGSHLGRTPFDVIRGNTALCMCEVIKKIVHPYDVHPTLYHLISSYFLALDRVEKSGNILIHFLAHLSVEIGFGPRYQNLEGPVFFDIKSGSFTRERPAHPMIIESEESAILQQVLQIPLDDIPSLSISRIRRQKLTDGLIDYIRYHSHAPQEIKSYELLKKLW